MAGTTLPSIHFQPINAGTQTHQGNYYHAAITTKSSEYPSAHQEIINLLKQLYLMPLNQRHVESDGLIFDPAQITKNLLVGWQCHMVIIIISFTIVKCRH